MNNSVNVNYALSKIGGGGGRWSVIFLGVPIYFKSCVFSLRNSTFINTKQNHHTCKNSFSLTNLIFSRSIFLNFEIMSSNCLRDGIAKGLDASNKNLFQLTNSESSEIWEANVWSWTLVCWLQKSGNISIPTYNKKMICVRKNNSTMWSISTTQKCWGEESLSLTKWKLAYIMKNKKSTLTLVDVRSRNISTNARHDIRPEGAAWTNWNKYLIINKIHEIVQINT